jgi:hypothetical protein
MIADGFCMGFWASEKVARDSWRRVLITRVPGRTRLCGLIDSRLQNRTSSR